jgi:Mg2+/Co2+ transporter CorB
MTIAFTTEILCVILFLLLILAAFFSASETSLLSINKYKLKHLAKTSKRAKLIQELINRPDKLLTVLLIGNTLVDMTASAIATIIGMRIMGDESGALPATIVLTIAVLIAEITPKIIATYKPFGVASIIVIPVKIFMFILHPFAWATNLISNLIINILGVKNTNLSSESLTAEELKTVLIDKNSSVPLRNQEMLSSILDLEFYTVSDVMVPRVEMNSIDLNDDENTIINQIKTLRHTMLPVYRGDINNLQGILHIRDISMMLLTQQFSKEALIKLLQKPYYVPEGTSLNSQIIHFQRHRCRFAIIVDEYGDILGLVTLEDILEEIIGDFSSEQREVLIIPEADGNFIVDATENIKDLNKLMSWHLPNNHAKTLSGAIINYLEYIPEPHTCLRLGEYKIEILLIQDNTIKSCRIIPAA